MKKKSNCKAKNKSKNNSKSNSKTKSIVLFLFFISLLLHVKFIYSQNTIDQLSDTEVTERINYIQGVLDEGQTCAQWWFYGWTIGYTALAAGHFTLHFVSDDKEFKQDMLVGGVTSTLGIAGMLIDPFVPAYGPGDLRSLPSNTPGEKRNKLKNAEDILKRSAQREIDGRAWLTHTLAFIVNLGGGLTIWQYYKRPFMDGLLNFAMGMAVSEIQIFSASSGWKKRGYRPEWFIAIYPGGLGIGMKF
jgi:hypothetical protein